MATLGNTPRPGYVYDTETDTWVPIGVGAHTHSYIPNTLVDAKGDIVTATADDTPAKLSKGTDGTVLVSDSTTSTGLAWQPYVAQHISGKNKVINGDMSVAQRGTSFTPASNVAVYPVDRWSALCTFSSGTFTASQQVFTPGAAPVAGYEGQYFLRAVTPSSGTTTYLEIAQKIENVRTLAGQTVTLSFWAKANTATQISGNPILRQTFGTSGSSYSDATIISGSGTLNLTTSWQRFSFTYSLPSISGKTIDTNSALIIYLTQYVAGGMSAGFTWDLWGVQLEAGPISTPFTTATGTTHGELAACQRYYWRQTNPISNNYTVLGSGFASSTTTVKGQIKLPQTMRTTPSSVEYSGVYAWDGVNLIGSLSGLALEYTNENYLNFTSLTAGGSFTQFRPYTILLSYPGQYIACSAEL